MSQEEAAREIAGDIRRRARNRKAGGYLFLLGAGASRSCGIPLAGEMVRDIQRRRRRRPAKAGPEVGSYQATMSLFSKEEQVSIIREYIERARVVDGRWKLNYCYLVLAEIWKNYPNYARTLLTTNFDPLFYYALLQQNIEAKLVRNFGEMRYMLPFDTTKFPAIVYLHGYWQNHHLYNDVSAWENFRDDWVNVLAPSLIPYGLVVLGYAGVEHDIVIQTLRSVREPDGSQMAGRVFWCHKGPVASDVVAVLRRAGDVVFVPIADADEFMLLVGAHLRLKEIEKTLAVRGVMSSVSPGPVTEFRNHASIAVSRGEAGVVDLCILTHPDYPKPGENYAGIDVWSVHCLFDLSNFETVVLDYDAVVEGPAVPPSPSFEFKLQSSQSAHIETVPLGSSRRCAIPLTRYAHDGVDLSSVDKIIVAANCEQIGCGSTLRLTLRRVTWAKATPPDAA